jgi:citrate lyase beta subunit
MPFASADGNSMVVDWKGNVLAESNVGETFTAFGAIDLAALRAARRKPGMTNYLARQRTEIFAAAYGAAIVHPAGTLLDNAPDRDHFLRVQNEVIDRLAKEGVI